MFKEFSYKFKIKWTSLLGVISFGILVPTFFIPLELGSKSHLMSVLVATCTSYVIWEGSKFIRALVAFLFPLEKNIIKHLTYEIAYIFIFSSISLIIGILTYGRLVSAVNISLSVVLQNIFVSFVLALLFIAINEGSFFFSKWKTSLVEQERLREENLIAKVESLKKQLDPHFLFNSLSVLSGVVYKDPELADRFITKLGQVYRYVLEHNDEKFVTLENEIDFVKAYCFLLNVRFLNKIELIIDVNPNFKQVLPLSLQLLVENAVKHNVISDIKPLKLLLYENNGFIWLENEKNLKLDSYSTKIGLKNLETRYQIVSNQSILVQDDGQIFKVGLPIIS